MDFISVIEGAANEVDWIAGITPVTKVFGLIV
jgi:hypothetical protein